MACYKLVNNGRASFSLRSALSNFSHGKDHCGPGREILLRYIKRVSYVYGNLTLSPPACGTTSPFPVVV